LGFGFVELILFKDVFANRLAIFKIVFFSYKINEFSVDKLIDDLSKSFTTYSKTNSCGVYISKIKSYKKSRVLMISVSKLFSSKYSLCRKQCSSSNTIDTV